MLDALVDVNVRDARIPMARKKARVYTMNNYCKFLMHQQISFTWSDTK